MLYKTLGEQNKYIIFLHNNCFYYKIKIAKQASDVKTQSIKY